MSRHELIKAEKRKANATGHDMGNVVNVSPFGEHGVALFAVCTKCKRCGKVLYVQKNADGDVKSWGPAVDNSCGP